MITPVITTSGLGAVLNATSDGFAARITDIALGDEAWTPDNSAVQLRNERRRIPISNGSRIQSNQIHITAVENGEEEYWIREIGFYLDNGTLLAIWSSEDQALAFKAAGVDVLLAFDLVMSALPNDSVEVVGTGGVNLPPATDVVVGVMRFATNDEALSGENRNTAMTPAGVQAHGDRRYAQSGHRHGWSEIEGRPNDFPPSSHTHSFDTLTDRPTGYPPSTHSHSWNSIVGRPTQFTPTSHNHDWNEINNRPSSYPPSEHTHSWETITGRPTQFTPTSHNHDWSDIDNRPTTYPASPHSHSWNSITDRPTSFNPTFHSHSWTQINGRPTTFPPETHTHPQYVIRNDLRVVTGFVATQARRSSASAALFNDWNSNYGIVSPPSGYTISDLMGFHAGIGLIYFAGDVNRDDRLYCRWRIQDNVIRVICANTENEGNDNNIGSYFNYMAIWQR